jgi:hypothetical protein
VGACEHGNESSGSIKGEELNEQQRGHQFLKYSDP